ncbi:hypothetical protein [Fictibacillus sp. KU28468]|uniref:hypothetical protein n=1 Tax=Fictibacillus sp. KU28468 TaxID=2991053 RepID=UPI00223DAFB2|nr:hypothetical protein [Fictibacillus sp. KU28468]UZJ79333.1 hypothetical protein OKX00_02245 [Fictibacillus sp. KU28468]
MKICVMKDCEKEAKARSLCHMHYKRWARHGNPAVTMITRVCQVEGCGKPHFCKGSCEKHYRRIRRQLLRQQKAK